ncbi:DUF1549 and DUF1553 domain-containing protein [Opitutales bacterium]|jgi:hypothetical protein|nr:DUF1549 and DUF1553 domain-containing protein [Opitutales bacterium]
MTYSIKYNQPSLGTPMPWLLAVAVCTFFALFSSDSQAEYSKQEKSYWAFQPISNPQVPETKERGWAHNEIDAFILSSLEANQLTPTQEADRSTLIRRATLDLHGLPPTPEAIARFVNDTSPDAYEKLIDRLLESPRYGERYARHWLDLVRYADSDGFKADVLRPNAWRYRDYVIDSLNHDKPYSRFVKEQIAGDELYPNNDDAKVATGYLRLWPYENNQPDMGRHWEASLDDITDVSGDVFLGMSMKCARCHDHKFDPISQKDYFRFRAFFSAISPWEEVYLGGDAAEQDYQKQFARWYAMTAPIQEEMDSIKADPWEARRQVGYNKLPPYIQEMMEKENRTPYEEQLARFAEKMMNYFATRDYEKSISNEHVQRWHELKKQLAQFDEFKPTEREAVSAVRDVGRTPPHTLLNTENGEEDIAPGYLSILDPGDAKITALDEQIHSTGRRSTLANWLTDNGNPLSNRVMVNRLWQWHFGSGLVNSSNDFGVLGDKPSHPELLDWLTQKFINENWSLKSMHRLIMTSAAYRQGSIRTEADMAEENDPENRLLWKMPVRRMDAEQLRDAMLHVTGEMDLTMGGRAVEEEASTRRSIYVVNKRNKHSTMMNNFDTPDLHNSCHLRDVTTTPIQALALINGTWTLKRAERFAEHLGNIEVQNKKERISIAFQKALGRAPKEDELKEAQAFLELTKDNPQEEREAWVDLCHVLINTNEFIYIN